MFVIHALLNLYSLVVFVSVVGSWIGSRHELFVQADRLVDPVLRPLRQRLPDFGGFDWSPLVLLVAIRLLSSLF